MKTPGPSAVSPPNETPPPAPASNGITDMDLDKILVDDWGAEGRKQRIYAQFQEGRSDKEIADILRDEYLRGGYNAQNSGFVQLADGGRGYSYFVAAELRLSRRDVDGPMRHVKYEEMAAHIRALIDEGRYLTPEELEQIMPPPAADISEPEPFTAPAMNDYNAVKAAHPDDIVLYQMGDFFELYGEDAKIAAPLLELNLTTRPVPGAGRVDMCGIPAHALEGYLEKLRTQYDVTISAVDAQNGE